MTYRLFVNADRTIMIRLWESGQCEIATRREPGDTWGPPVQMIEEPVMAAQR